MLSGNIKKRRRKLICAAAVLAMATLVPRLVLADMIVLRDTSELHGTVANREQVAQTPDRQSQVSILIDDTGEFRTIPVGDIQYLVLEDGEQRRIVTFSAPSGDPSAAPVGGPRTNEKGSNNGIALMAVGAAIGLVGGIVKFGDEKLTVTSGSVSYDDKTYNAANYVMIGAGAVLFLVGATMQARNNARAEHALLQVGDRDVRVGVRFSLP